MLYRFLIQNREKILASTREKTNALADRRPVSEASEKGLPSFYDHLVSELRREARGLPKRSERKHGPNSTLLHGRELSRLGYTVSQVVHGYGVLCQAITEVAEKASAPISAGEFSTLNLCLDVAIAEAVTGFTKDASLADVDSANRMGFLVHELRNALAAAIVAHSMVEKGVVGVGGSTNALLKRNLNRMRDILDRSFSEVRMHNDKAVDLRGVRLIDVVEEVEATASEDARVKGMTIAVEVAADLHVEADRNYLISALSNLVQNAVKYSKAGAAIRVRGLETEKSVVLEVEDRCGGLPKGKAAELFRPYVQKGADRSGLGLGLTISRQAVALNGGVLSVRDLPGKGCVFAIALPKQHAARRPGAPAGAGRA
jgi:signal transduction histidine kinase